ncbi:hypothetical protein LCGC14_1542140 [marine sediment metagenome]|uniref:Uncharacterized protein n=1 Tax=marine sediment metagenome TaxID=412755 RepID=A0A0F9IST6_9ZZZZ
MNWFIDVMSGTTGDLLFTLELPSIPESGSFLTYTPLTGPVVKYRVDDVNIKVSEAQMIDPAPVDPEAPSIGYAARITVEVSVVP